MRLFSPQKFMSVVIIYTQKIPFLALPRVLSHFLRQPSDIFTQIYLPYLWHFATLAADLYIYNIHTSTSSLKELLSALIKRADEVHGILLPESGCFWQDVLRIQKLKANCRVSHGPLLRNPLQILPDYLWLPSRNILHFKLDTWKSKYFFKMSNFEG